MTTYTCPDCGARLERMNGAYVCIHCGAKYRADDLPDQRGEYDAPCPQCDGSGERGGEICERCFGSGVRL